MNLTFSMPLKQPILLNQFWMWFRQNFSAADSETWKNHSTITFVGSTKVEFEKKKRDFSIISQTNTMKTTSTPVFSRRQKRYFSLQSSCKIIYFYYCPEFRKNGYRITVDMWICSRKTDQFLIPDKKNDTHNEGHLFYFNSILLYHKVIKILRYFFQSLNWTKNELISDILSRSGT